MKICVPELKNPIMQEAVREFPEIEFLAAESLAQGCEMVKTGVADTMLSGLDFSSRDVLLAYRDAFELSSEFFSSSFVGEKDGHYLVLADGGVNKQPNAEQLYAITVDSARTFEQYFGEQPRIAMLSYSTFGSGGKNPDLAKIYAVIERVRQEWPEWLIEGEMQLDAAINPVVATKKVPDSLLGGAANVLIVPDLNTGNIMYKTMEQFGGWTMAGPIIQGFEVPLADLSRGSSVEDVVLTIRVMEKLCAVAGKSAAGGSAGDSTGDLTENKTEERR